MRMLKVKDVAQALNVTPHTVRLWLRTGRLKSFKLGRTTVRIREQELENFIAAGAR